MADGTNDYFGTYSGVNYRRILVHVVEHTISDPNLRTFYLRPFQI